MPWKGERVKCGGLLLLREVGCVGAVSMFVGRAALAHRLLILCCLAPSSQQRCASLLTLKKREEAPRLTFALCSHPLLLPLVPRCLLLHTPQRTDTLFFSTVAVISIASLNLSLLVNPVGLYQVRMGRCFPRRTFNVINVVAVETRHASQQPRVSFCGLATCTAKLCTCIHVDPCALFCCFARLSPVSRQCVVL